MRGDRSPIIKKLYSKKSKRMDSYQNIEDNNNFLLFVLVIFVMVQNGCEK